MGQGKNGHPYISFMSSKSITSMISILLRNCFSVSYQTGVIFFIHSHHLSVINSIHFIHFVCVKSICFSAAPLASPCSSQYHQTIPLAFKLVSWSPLCPLSIYSPYFFKIVLLKTETVSFLPLAHPISCPI